MKVNRSFLKAALVMFGFVALLITNGCASGEKVTGMEIRNPFVLKTEPASTQNQSTSTHKTVSKPNRERLRLNFQAITPDSSLVSLKWMLGWWESEGPWKSEQCPSGFGLDAAVFIQEITSTSITLHYTWWGGNDEVTCNGVKMDLPGTIIVTNAKYQMKGERVIVTFTSPSGVKFTFTFLGSGCAGEAEIGRYRYKISMS